jgi:hypothetical protein
MFWFIFFPDNVERGVETVLFGGKAQGGKGRETVV